LNLVSYELRLAEAYYRLLTSLDWSDRLLIAGLREGLNKFLSNAFLSMFADTNKYHRTHLVSLCALQQLRSRNTVGLVWEHVVPKTEYVQRPCEELAVRGELTIEFIEDRLRRYWQVAAVTELENARLPPKMPTGWDGTDILARYRVAGIELIANPFFPGVA
jgi:hypothetical protein